MHVMHALIIQKMNSPWPEHFKCIDTRSSYVACFAHLEFYKNQFTVIICNQALNPVKLTLIQRTAVVREGSKAVQALAKINFTFRSKEMFTCVFKAAENLQILICIFVTPKGLRSAKLQDNTQGVPPCKSFSLT